MNETVLTIIVALATLALIVVAAGWLLWALVRFIKWCAK